MRKRKPDQEPAAFLGRLADQRRERGVVSLDRSGEVVGGVVKIADRLALLDSLPRGKVRMS